MAAVDAREPVPPLPVRGASGGASVARRPRSEAVAVLERGLAATEQASEQLLLCLELAEVLRGMDPKGALEYLRAAVRLTGGAPGPALSIALADVSAELGRFDEAIAAY